MTITTKRLTIRDFKAEDLLDLHEILGDAETMRYLEPPFSLNKTEEFLRDFCIEKHGALAAQLHSGNVIGYLLFCPASPGVYELGWVFNRAFWRQGYAYEAASAVIDYGFRELSLKKIISETVDPSKAVRLMKKLGMKREGVLPTRDTYGYETNMLLYGITDKEQGCENV